MVSQQQERPQHPHLPQCPLCRGQQFRREEGRLDSKWGFTTHKLILLVCERCQYILQFYDGNSIWDFE